MKRVLNFTGKKRTLKRQLFGYMFFLVVLLLMLLFIGMLLINGYSGTKQRVYDTLAFQSEVFERQITSHYSNLAVMGTQLSEGTGKRIDKYLEDNGMGFDGLNGSQSHITELQEILIDPLRQKLFETDCTGAFILLETRINSDIENAADSRSGLYLQRNSLDYTDTNILLYRGLAEVGKNHDAMPHRKWRLEFDRNVFPNYDTLVAEAEMPDACGDGERLTDVVTLPGSSERVMLLTIPIFGENGSFYGLCGFEISESYFKHTFAQPSEFNHVIFCLSHGQYGLTDADSSLTAGLVNSYYLSPDGEFRSEPFGKGLFSCENENQAYVGTIENLRLFKGDDVFSVSTLMPREDYDRLAFGNSLRIALLLFVIVVCAVVCCIYFSERYLKPLKRSLEQIRKKEYANAEGEAKEIDDLFAFLAEQDRQSEAAFAAVQNEKNSIALELLHINNERAMDKQEIQRLAYLRKTEVDPDDYENFRQGIQYLTATEKRVFNYYLEGKSVKEIIELMGVKESTVRFHNRNIYTTLGVNSLKQLLRYAAILKQEGESEDSGD